MNLEHRDACEERGARADVIEFGMVFRTGELSKGRGIIGEVSGFSADVEATWIEKGFGHKLGDCARGI